MADATSIVSGAAAAAAAVPSKPDYDDVTQSLPPSHILQDGRFVFLPPPTRKECIHFFERSIAKHGLLQEDMEVKKKQQEKQKQEEEKKEEAKKKESTKVHPLALASARLQADGINELNRAINLSTLVTSGEYFGLTNIVDPSLEITAATASADAGKSGEKEKATTPAAPAAAAAPGATDSSALDMQDEQRIKAQFVLKRKRLQFEKAKTVLSRHSRRLQAAILAQARPDQRLLELRSKQSWRLVAPEHGTRALPHAARPTEVVACDVDLYHLQHQQQQLQQQTAAAQKKDPHAGRSAVQKQQQQLQQQQNVLGRIASRVPRYATMELREDYLPDDDLRQWNKKFFKLDDGEESDGMDVEAENEETGRNEADINESDEPRKKKIKLSESGTIETKKSGEEVWTRAEPFAIADPTLGKLDADFDPKKVAMLSLRFDIEKASTGFRQSAVLQPLSHESCTTEIAMNGAKQTPATTTEGGSHSDSFTMPQDEVVLSALQHSLFCAKLFESIRRELAPDTEDIGHTQITAAKKQSVVWLSGCEAETNFLPPPSQLSSGVDQLRSMALLSVIHCHEGEVKVQLDGEYTLTVKLVEAGQETDEFPPSSPSNGRKNQTPDSGSQTPEQLLLLCRALLLHAQERYHEHSIKAADKLRRQQEEEERNPIVHMRKKEAFTSPCILQSCVSLGSKMLFERRIRQTLKNINEWVKSVTKGSSNESTEVAGGTTSSERLYVDWLSLSLFDLHSHFTISFRSAVIDVYMIYEELTVTSMNDDGEYRKVKFHSEAEFELFLKLTIRRLLRDGRV